MPTLLYEHDGLRQGGLIDGRVLIGRRLTHGVIVVDPAVSRLHAWIAKDQDGYYMLTDAGSRTGTFVNGQTVTRHELQDGDRIEVGPALLTFLEDNELPDDAEPVALTSPQATIESSHAGILFDCQCGAPLWVGNELAGKRGLCRYCGETLEVPKLKRSDRKKAKTKSVPAASPAAAKIASKPTPPTSPTPPAAAELPVAEPIAVDAALARLAVPEQPTPAEAEPMSPVLEVPASEPIPDIAPLQPSELASPVDEPPAELPPEASPEPLPEVVIKPKSTPLSPSAFTPRFVPLSMPSETDLLGDDPDPPNVFADVKGLSESRVDEVSALAAAPRPQAPPRGDLAACGVCHSGIEADDETTTCPGCHTTFHTDCWLENYGCSTYGCPQVNALKPASVKAAEQKQVEVFTASAADAEAVPFPLELVLLASSAIGTLLGALLFGAVPLCVTLLALLVLATRPLRRPGLVMLAIVIGLAGTVGGVALSDFWYFNGRHLAMLH